jgi:hypothetical protein
VGTERAPTRRGTRVFTRIQKTSGPSRAMQTAKSLCVPLCPFARVYLCECAGCVLACACACERACACVRRVHLCVCACECAWLCVWVRACVHACACVCVHEGACVRGCVCLCAHVRACVCMRACLVHVCVCVCTTGTQAHLTPTAAWCQRPVPAHARKSGTRGTQEVLTGVLTGHSRGTHAVRKG